MVSSGAIFLYFWWPKNRLKDFDLSGTARGATVGQSRGFQIVLSRNFVGEVAFAFILAPEVGNNNATSSFKRRNEGVPVIVQYKYSHCTVAPTCTV